MSILSICDNGDILNAFRVIKILIRIIKIIVPIILIISLSLKYINAITSNDQNALSKANKNVIPGVVAIAIVFLVPTLITTVAHVTSTDDGWSKCIDNATKEGINAAYIEAANDYIKITKESLNNSDYNVAISEINKIKDSNKKEELKNELQIIKNYINIKESIYRVANNYDSASHQKVLNQINSITDAAVREKLSKLASDIIIIPHNSDGGGSGSNTDSGGHSVTPMNMVSIDVSSLSCPIYYGNNTTPRKTIQFHPEIGKELIQIFENMCPYIKSNPYINKLQDAGFGVQRAGGEHDFHAKGLAFDLSTDWSYTSPKTGKTYRPYASQGTGDWNTYVAFICDVCNGIEDCEQNVNYQIFNRYFKGKGWCWGGNWGPSSFDPMHFEYRSTCLTSNKQKIVCN